MVITQTYNQAPAIILPLLFFSILLPDFQPKIFLSFSVFLYIVIAFILVYYKEIDNNFFDTRLFIFNMFAIVIVTKLLLYNIKVKTFIYISEIKELGSR